MNIKSLHLKNIGPFREAEMNFATPKDGVYKHAITVVTGLNGAGKSVVIDAIRGALGGFNPGRDIVANHDDFLIQMDVSIDGTEKRIQSDKIKNGGIWYADYVGIGQYIQRGYQEGEKPYKWVLDYWASQLPADTFTINSLSRIDHSQVLKGVLQGKKSNVQLINFICHVDYLRDSEMEKERNIGNVLYDLVKRIIDMCLDNGKFYYIRRTDLTPIVVQNGQELTLDKLSSGNIFLIEHLLLLLSKMYSVSVLCNIPANQIKDIGGLLLVDEIENHLHPRWQKQVLGMICDLFPNLQLIVTTHSPFVVSSMHGMKIYTCKPQTGYSTVEDETQRYDTMPVEDVLLSDVFGVSQFNGVITELMRKRKKLLQEGNDEEAKAVGQQLYELNPEYFFLMKNG